MEEGEPLPVGGVAGEKNSDVTNQAWQLATSPAPDV